MQVIDSPWAHSNNDDDAESKAKEKQDNGHQSENAKTAVEVAAEPEEDADDGFLEDMWSVYDGLKQSNDAPNGTVQSCYWTDGTTIVRKKINGVWQYKCDHE